jgi:hypothetical protein
MEGVYHAPCGDAGDGAQGITVGGGCELCEAEFMSEDDLRELFRPVESSTCAPQAAFVPPAFTPQAPPEQQQNPLFGRGAVIPLAPPRNKPQQQERTRTHGKSNS